MNKDFNSDYIKQVIGCEISKHRHLLGLSQSAFAKLIGMKAAQFCKIEKGKNLPGDKVLAKIEEGLRLPPQSLVSLRNQLSEQICTDATMSADNSERLIPTCPQHTMDRLFYQQLTAHLPPILDKYIELEDKLGIPHHGTLFVDALPAETMEDAFDLSAVIRERLDVGSAPFVTCLPVLEQHKVRIIFIDSLPHIHVNRHSHNRSSFSFYDSRDHLPVICINRTVPVEEQLYHIAYELGEYLHFRWISSHPTAEPDDSSHFCRVFAATLLMPPERMRFDLLQLSPQPHEWTIDMMEELSRLYGVSALAVVWYLRSFAQVLDDNLAQKFIEQLNDTSYALRQDNRPPRPPLPENAWLKLLTERVRARKAKEQSAL